MKRRLDNDEEVTENGEAKRQRIESKTTSSETVDDLLLKSESISTNRVQTHQQKQALKSILKRAYKSKPPVTPSNNVKVVAPTKEKSLELKSLSSIPLDWSVQSTLSISSSKSFLWASHLTDMAKTHGLRSFVGRRNSISESLSQSSTGCSQQSGTSGDQSLNLTLDACSELYRNMLYFQFPSSLLPASVQDKMKLLSFQEPTIRRVQEDTEYISSEEQPAREYSKTEQDFALHGYEVFKDILVGDVSFLNERMQDWCDSFQSAFTILCNGDCPYFYVLSENRFVILFINGGVCRSTLPIRAIVTPTSMQQMKRKLEDNNITYFKDNGTSVVFVGRRQVNALSAFLLSDCVKHVSSDFPTIVAPVAFMNASLKALKITQNQITAVSKKKDQATENNVESMYTLAFSGVILPHAKIGLSRAITRTFSEDIVDNHSTNDRLFTVSSTCLKLTSNLNLHLEEETITPSPSQYSQSTPTLGMCMWNKKSGEDEIDDDLFNSLMPDQYQQVRELDHCFISKISLMKSGSYTVKLTK